jgi:hypothetical protein
MWSYVEQYVELCGAITKVRRLEGYKVRGLEGYRGCYSEKNLWGV